MNKLQQNEYEREIKQLNNKLLEKVKKDLGISNVTKIREVKPEKVGS